MPVEAKTEVGQPAVAPAPAKVDPRQRPDAIVVTPENFGKYVDEKLGPKVAEEAEPDVNDPDAVAAAELKKLDKAKADAKAKEAAENEEIDHPEPGKKERLNSRFSELTEKRKAAEAKAAAESKAAADERQRADALQAERDALKAKYEPPKSDVLGPEPTPDQFVNPTEYGKALKDWTAESVRQEDARKANEARAKQEGEQVAKVWTERVKATQGKLPDYEEKLNAASAAGVKISNEAREAIVRSDVGPEILYHLASNPEVAANLAKLNIGDMYYAIGKIAAQVGGTLNKADSTVTSSTAAKAEISNAPAPIKPINGGGSAAVTRLSGSDEWHGSFEEYKGSARQGISNSAWEGGLTVYAN